MLIRSRTYHEAIAARDAERVRREALEQRIVGLEKESARREVLERHVLQQHALMQFICARVNQLEMERALLVRKLTNVEIPVPSLTATPPSPGPSAAASKSVQALSSLAGAAMFDDMGDEAAKALGVKWDKDGRVIFDASEDDEQELADVSTR